MVIVYIATQLFAKAIAQKLLSTFAAKSIIFISKRLVLNHFELSASNHGRAYSFWYLWRKCVQEPRKQGEVENSPRNYDQNEVMQLCYEA